MVTGEGEVGAASVDKRCGIPFDDVTAIDQGSIYYNNVAQRIRGPGEEITMLFLRRDLLVSWYNLNVEDGPEAVPTPLPPSAPTSPLPAASSGPPVVDETGLALFHYSSSAYSHDMSGDENTSQTREARSGGDLRFEQRNARPAPSSALTVVGQDLKRKRGARLRFHQRISASP